VYYGIYMATQTLNQLNGLPFAARVLWPKFAAAPWMFDIVTYMTLLPLSFMFFLRDALGTRRQPVLDRMILASGVIDSFVGIAYFALDRYGGTSLQAHILQLVYVTSFIVMSGVAFVRWRQRYVSAGIYLIGLAGVVAGFAAVPIIDGAIDTADIGFVWEAVAFLAAIAYRLVATTKEREGALAEVVASKEALAQEFALRVEAAERFKEAFGRFVPREFLEQLGHEDVRQVELGDHVEREMTVLFCDIRGFVALSEQLTPQATFDFLNLYFGRVGPVIRANRGFIDKYVGDGVMALFPGPADDAIRAAIALHGEVRRFNEARARDGSQPIEVGVGLHRGRLMLATVGECERYDTTVIADVVNVAARLEGLTNVYGARIIVSAAVVSSALDPEAYNLRWLGDMRVRGSALPTSVYEVCDGDATQLLLHKRATAGSFAAALAAYRNGDFSASFAMFAELVRSEPQDEVARFFMERSDLRARDAGGWDGVEHHDRKR
jgi:class 3 adenylate cyclase